MKVAPAMDTLASIISSRSLNPTNDSGTSVASDQGEPGKLTLNPESIRTGIRFLDRCRRSVQLKPIEKLGRCRVLFHHLSEQHLLNTERLQDQIFGNNFLAGSIVYGDFVKEYHVHTILAEGSSTFCRPTADDCISSSSSTCSFELHEMVGRVSEKTSIDRNHRDQLLALPDTAASGSISVGTIKRYVDTDTSKMHLEVLSLTGSNISTQTIAERKAWYSPIIYCKYSVNIIVVDVGIFLTERSLYEDTLCKVLCEIKTYSKDWTASADIGEHHANTNAKVLLVITNDEPSQEQHLTRVIMDKLRTYRSMLILSDGDVPFVSFPRVQLIRRVLQRELRLISGKAVSSLHMYTHAGVILSQQLSSADMDILDLQGLRSRLRNTLVTDGTALEVDLEVAQTSTLHYLQNTGLAYIPG